MCQTACTDLISICTDAGILSTARTALAIAHPVLRTDSAEAEKAGILLVGFSDDIRDDLPTVRLDWSSMMLLLMVCCVSIFLPF